MARILVVDDDPPIRVWARAVLTAAGHDVTLAAGGREALDLAEAGGDFDLVLLDLRMPEMDGNQVIESIRAHPGPHRVVILFTGFAGELTASGAPLAGVLHKPASSAELTRRVEEALGIGGGGECSP